jgi:quinol monooxygenase YgiN
MYGTIARLFIKPGSFERLQEMTQRWQAELPAGHVAAYIYQMDKNPNELYMIAVFESKEQYVANANSAEQNRRFNEMMQLLEREPEWHDGDIVALLLR